MGEGIFKHGLNINRQLSRNEGDAFRENRNYYLESKRLRKEALALASEKYKTPKRLTIFNGITMEVEISKSDIKTIVSKATEDNKFNAIKNALAKDIPGFINKSVYLGDKPTVPGKHPEAAYFSYFNRTINQNYILCMRKMKETGLYKPYAIITQEMYDAL